DAGQQNLRELQPVGIDGSGVHGGKQQACHGDRQGGTAAPPPAGQRQHAIKEVMAEQRFLDDGGEREHGHQHRPHQNGRQFEQPPRQAFGGGGGLEVEAQRQRQG